MQEIIPALERAWVGARREGQHEVAVLNVDETPMTKILQSALNADNIVLTCFNAKISRVARTLRALYEIDARYFIYLHNQTTIACWPFHVWGLAEVLRQDDIFLSSCAKDAEGVRHSFEDACVKTVPFTIPSVEGFAPSAHSSSPDFVFIGRISAQKNLHGLVYAFYLLRTELPEFPGRLIFYGGEDGLGSPNMGVRSNNYRASLEELVARLGLTDRIRFEGFKPREAVHRELDGRDYIFVSPSLHSDENFGMAAFRSLCGGHAAVLSHWGGHADLKENFPEQVFTVPVLGSAAGPWIDPCELARTLKRALHERVLIRRAIPELYREENVSRVLLDWALTPWSPGPRLKPSRTALEVLSRRKAFFEAGEDPCKIFGSYSDPLAIPFFSAYGMSPVGSARSVPSKIAAHPWVKVEAGKAFCEDPHRGNEQIGLGAPQAEGSKVELRDFFGTVVDIDETVAQDLMIRGWALASPE